MAEPWCVALVRSPHPHAVLFGIDVGSVADLAGVQEILTAVDLPGAFTYGPARADRPVLASGVVRHIGEPVAAVLAVDKESAQLAAQHLVVHYRKLPAVEYPSTALSGDPIHPDGTVIARVHLRRGVEFAPLELAGDDESGPPMPGASVVVEGFYSLAQPVGPWPGEVTAQPCEGGVEIALPGQLSIDLRDQIAACLGVDGPAVRLRCGEGPPDPSAELSAAIVAGLVALRHQHAVRVVDVPVRRAEPPEPLLTDIAAPAVFPGAPLPVRRRDWAALAYRHHADAEGNLVGVQAEIRIDAGAYAGDCAVLVAALCAAGVGPYRVENVDLDIAAVRTTNRPLPALAGGGVEAVTFAVEAQMADLALVLQADGLELCARNALDLDHPLPTGQFLPTTTPALTLLDRLAVAPLPAGAPDRFDPHLRRRTGHAVAVIPRVGSGQIAATGGVPTLAAGSATGAVFARTGGAVGVVEGLDDHGQGRAFAGFAVVAARIVIDSDNVGEVTVRDLRIEVQAPGPVPDGASSAIERGARAALRIAFPDASEPGVVGVEMLPGPAAGVALDADADQIPVGAVMAALRTAIGGPSGVLPIPGVSWRMHTVRIPDSDGAS